MTLSKAAPGSGHRIIACKACGNERCKLETMGLVPGECVNVISSSASGLIVEVKHSRLALSLEAADSLIVS
ncbi:MAG: ferrous iron transport protein A [Coriobacteriales bacterium]|nr:ferrous iron transport protein A [Coriobacteriales bacterium]